MADVINMHEFKRRQNSNSIVRESNANKLSQSEKDLLQGKLDWLNIVYEAELGILTQRKRTLKFVERQILIVTKQLSMQLISENCRNDLQEMKDHKEELKYDINYINNSRQKIDQEAMEIHHQLNSN